MNRRLRSRLALFFNIKTSAALDQLEDPREVLDYAYSQQQLHVRTIKRGLVEVATARRQLEQQAERLRTRAQRLEDQARRALRAQREELARQALERKQVTLQEIRAVEDQIESIGREEARMRLADERMSERAARFRLHRTVSEARYAAAEAQVSVGEALSGLSPEEQTELSLAVERSEERIDSLTARATAIADVLETELTPVTAPEDVLERELNSLEATEAVERELRALKARVEAETMEATDEDKDA